jgi:hypothetical protein
MIEDPSIGLKIAETPREAMIKELIDSSEKRILQIELTLELEKNALQFLKTLK